MSLRRSPSALLSLHRFFGADVVVYCEGGIPLDRPAILAGGGADGTLDILYWSSLRKFVGCQRTAHFKSVGGKATLLSLAQDVTAAGVTSVSVCMDSDYDDLRGTPSMGPRIATTYGYSWENDVSEWRVIEAVARSLMGPGAATDTTINAMRLKVAGLMQSTVRAAEIDYALVTRGRPALIDRDRPGLLLSINDRRFVVCPKQVRSRQKALGLKRAPNRVRNFTPVEVRRWGVGRFVLRGIHFIFDSLARAHDPSLRIDYPVFARMLIAETFRALQQGQLDRLSAHIGAKSAALQ